MIYSREQHHQFLEEELRAQTDAFKYKLETSALYLLQEREEIFICQFLKFDDGEMILMFSNKRGLPRQGEYLYCFTIPKELRDYRNWGERTYGDLIAQKDNYTEVVCIWQAPSDDKDFCIAGFRGVELEFASHIQNTPGMILVLGPNQPPFEYITNLQKIVLHQSHEGINRLLDHDFIYSDWSPTLIDGKSDIIQFILGQLQLQDTIIIQGPPGTGKTFLIAQLIEKLANENKSVLVTALTNRALIEIVQKEKDIPNLKILLENHRILKTKLSVDESRLFKDLKQVKEINPQPGNIILSTFYITSGQASEIMSEQPFDYVIVDEASQALLGMFAGAVLLGKKNIWVGDTKQLPPVVVLSEDKVNKKNYGALVDGLKALADNSFVPIFQLSESYRLPDRAIRYTGIFYKDTLKSKSKRDIRLDFKELPGHINKFFHSSGGPTLIKTDLPIGEYRPINGIQLTCELVLNILSIKDNLHISVLSYFVETTKALQKKIYQTVGYRKNLLVETVSRIQGITTDICIFFVPNVSYHRSFEKRLFNVATSRSCRHTIIITDKNSLSRHQIDNEVKQFLNQLDNEFSFYVNTDQSNKMLTQ